MPLRDAEEFLGINHLYGSVMIQTRRFKVDYCHEDYGLTLARIWVVIEECASILAPSGLLTTLLMKEPHLTV